MPTSRSIPEAQWELARRSLIFYFSRRHGFHLAEDLAHDTIAALLRRDDYEFDNPEDFARVCQAFAKRVAMEAARRRQRRLLEDDLSALPVRGQTAGLTAAEIQILLDEVLRVGRADVKDFPLVEWVAAGNGALTLGGENKGSSLRVRLYRARKKLADLTGFKRK